MEGLAAPFFIASALLAFAGGAKLARPEPTAGALRSVGLPSHRVLAQALGLAELAIGATALAFGGPIPAIGVGLAYLAFSVFVVVALRRGGTVASCGCFGVEDSPPTLVHLALDLLAAGVAFGAAAGSIGGVVDVLAEQPAAGVPFLGFVVIGTWFAYLALSVLPTVIPAGART